MKNNKRKVLLIKELLDKGYSEKVITMVLKVKQPYVNKIKHGKLHKNTVLEDGEVLEMDKDEQMRLNAADRILQCSELYTTDPDQDIIYMQLLKYFLVPKEKIQELYSHYTKARVSRSLMRKDVDLLEFDSTLIGIDKYTYLDLMIE